MIRARCTHEPIWDRTCSAAGFRLPLGKGPVGHVWGVVTVLMTFLGGLRGPESAPCIYLFIFRFKSNLLINIPFSQPNEHVRLLREIIS